MERLSDAKARAIQPGEVLPDGTVEGLTLAGSNRKGRGNWNLRYTSPILKKRRNMGLGAYPIIGIAAARDAAIEARRLIAAGRDPIDEREAAKPKPPVPIPTFGEIAELVIEAASEATDSEKSRYTWRHVLGRSHCGPLLDRRVNEISLLDIAETLRPVWREKPGLARKVFPAIRRVFDHARVILRDRHGIAFENPARWDDLRAMGWEQPKVLSRGHHPALPYQQMPAFMATLRQIDAPTARCLEFLILTGVRTAPALGVTWDQINLDEAIWSVPIELLKDRKTRKAPFRIPLSPRAVQIMREMEKASVSEFVFPGRSGGRIGEMTLLQLLKAMQRDGDWCDPDGRPAVVHGFRSSFRTWAEEVATFPHAVVETAMGHVVGSAVERAYRRTDLLDQRRGLMDAWASHCQPGAAPNVVPFKRQKP